MCNSSWAENEVLVVDKAPEFRQFNRIEITGSSIVRKDITAALPVQVITRQDIQNSTAKNLEDLIQAHPAMLNFSQASNLGLTRAGYASAALHGMPTGTLVLLNGQRLASYPRQTIITQERSGTELSQIPLSAVDRIELLTDGASSLYGTDAIAGVVNIITHSERKRWEVTAHTRVPDQQKGLGHGLQITGGAGNLTRDGFSWVISAEFEKQNPLFGRDRPMASQGRYSFMHQGKSYTVDNPDLTPAQSIPTLSDTDKTSAPFGRLWNKLAENGSCSNQMVLDLTQSACLYNSYKDKSLSPMQEIQRVHSQMQWDTSMGLAYAEMMHGQVTQENHSFRWDTYVSRIGSNRTDPGYALALNQGYIPGQTFLLWRPSEIGTLRQFYKDEYTRVRTGLRNTWSGWDFHAQATWAESQGQWSRETATYPNLGRTTDDYRVLTNETLLTSLNAGTASSEQLKALLLDLPRQKIYDRGITQMQSFQWNASKAVGEFNGQEILLGWGLEWRHHKDRYSKINSDQPSFNAARQIAAQYAELIWPMATNVELTGAIRHDEYSDFGHTVNRKLAGKWAITPQWLLRGSIGTGFRAPTLGQMTETEIYSSATISGVNCSADLQAVALQLSHALGRPGRCVNDGRLWLSGQGSRDLQPETSRQQTLGLRFTPHTNHSLGLDYWRIQMQNTIRQYPFAQVLAAPLQNTQYFTLDPQGRLDLYLPMVNLGSSEKAGLDLSWIYRVPLDMGRLHFQFDTTRYLKSELTLSGLSSDLGQFSTASGTVTPRFAHRWSTAYQFAQGSISATLNYTSSYVGGPFTAKDTETGQSTTINQFKVPAFWTLDLQGHYKWNPNLTIKVAIGNALNRPAPVSFTQNTSNAFGVNTNLSSTWGRTVYLGATALF